MDAFFAKHSNLVALGLFLLILLMTIALMVIGRTILIPILLAVALWSLINDVTVMVQKWQIAQIRIPQPLALIVIFLFFTAILGWIATVFYYEYFSFVEQMPAHEENLYKLLEASVPAFVWGMLPFNAPGNATAITDTIFTLVFDYFSNSASQLAASVAGLLGQAILILLYVIFLLSEQNTFLDKLQSMLPEQTQRAEWESIFASIHANVQRYLTVKTYVSILTALASYVVMKILGLEHTAVWAILIFFLNFIPNIGSIVATLFPTMTAILQFGNWSAVLVIFFVLGTIQFIVGSFVEPRLMGDRLNLSPFVVLVSLAFFGTVWGVVGMVLSVPLTVILMIILSHFQSTRGLAIILSGNGMIGGEELCEPRN